MSTPTTKPTAGWGWRGPAIGVVFALALLGGVAAVASAQSNDSDEPHANDNDSSETHDGGEDGDRGHGAEEGSGHDGDGAEHDGAEEGSGHDEDG